MADLTIACVLGVWVLVACAAILVWAVMGGIGESAGRTVATVGRALVSLPVSAPRVLARTPAEFRAWRAQHDAAMARAATEPGTRVSLTPPADIRAAWEARAAERGLRVPTDIAPTAVDASLLEPATPDECTPWAPQCVVPTPDDNSGMFSLVFLPAIDSVPGVTETDHDRSGMRGLPAFATPVYTAPYIAGIALLVLMLRCAIHPSGEPYSAEIAVPSAGENAQILVCYDRGADGACIIIDESAARGEE